MGNTQLPSVPLLQHMMIKPWNYFDELASMVRWRHRVQWAGGGSGPPMRGGRGPLLCPCCPHLPLLMHDCLHTQAPPGFSCLQDIVDKFQYPATNPDLGNPATTRWVE